MKSAASSPPDFPCLDSILQSYAILKETFTETLSDLTFYEIYVYLLFSFTLLGRYVIFCSCSVHRIQNINSILTCLLISKK